jgi:hypothetical protein
MVYNPRPPAPTAVRAWLDAALFLKAEGPLSGLMLHVEEPDRFDPQEEAIVVAVDRFLRQHGTHPVSSVSNTIFPAALVRADGIVGLRERYLEGYRRAMCRQGQWGRYFHRMVAWPGPDGPVDQIGEIIDMLHKATAPGGRFYENIYEIALFDPVRDLKKRSNRQCLSFIELKPDRDGRVHMMAVYRNHFYIQRTLGNLIGLGRLQAFIAAEAGLSVGTLTIQSTHAEMETRPWSKTAAHALIDRCARLLQATAA